MTPEDLFAAAASEGMPNACWKLRDASAAAMNAERLAAWEARYRPLRQADEANVRRSAAVIDLPSFAVLRAQMRNGIADASRVIDAKGYRMHPKVAAARKAGKP